MRRLIGRRAMFFWIASLVCVALVPASPAEFRWVPWVTAGIGFFWAVLLTVEDLFGPSSQPRTWKDDRARTAGEGPPGPAV